MLKRTTWSFFSGGELTFGPGAVGTLARGVKRRGAQRVLIITDEILQKVGIVDQVQASIEIAGAESLLFTGGEIEPSTETVEKVIEVADEFPPDLFVAVGGGSNMDLAKATKASFVHQRNVDTLFGFDAVPAPGVSAPLLVCIPTTAGTGSEVSHSAILKNSATGKKSAILSQHIRPDVAIVDPQLTLSCPAKVTAESGIDALTHAIESFLVSNFYSFSEDMENGLAYEGNHPLGDMYAEKAIRLIGKNLRVVCEEHDNLAARSSMAFAATMAGVSFSTCGVALAHALEYPIGSMFKCSHGAGNGIVLPAVMRFWMASRQSRIAQIARFLEIPDVDQMTEAEAAESAITWVESVRSAVGLPTCLSEVGASATQIDELATTAISLQRLIDLSPALPTLDDAKSILKASL